jgi:hypothetical protein
MASQGWIQTFSGNMVEPLDPDPESLCLTDIAHSLSMQCRFTGHTKTFYSTARHSINCYLGLVHVWPEIENKLDYGYDRETCLRTMLLHDASEAYLSDIARPVKYLPEMAFYRKAEGALEEVLASRFSLIYPLPEALKTIDSAVLGLEAGKLLSTPPIGNWHERCPKISFTGITVRSDPKTDKREFLKIARDLFRELYT